MDSGCGWKRHIEHQETRDESFESQIVVIDERGIASPTKFQHEE
jgi:hypothetical protein